MRNIRYHAVPNKPGLPMTITNATSGAPSSFQTRVDAAALLLVREGRHPTVNAVRERMGGASPNLVGPALRVWRDKFGRTLAQAETALNSAPVPSIVLELASVLWSAALAEAERLRTDSPTSATESAEKLVRQLAALVNRLQPTTLRQPRTTKRSSPTERRTVEPRPRTHRVASRSRPATKKRSHSGPASTPRAVPKPAPRVRRRRGRDDRRPPPPRRRSR
jgi:hypothetical protein